MGLFSAPDPPVLTMSTPCGPFWYNVWILELHFTCSSSILRKLSTACRGRGQKGDHADDVSPKKKREASTVRLKIYTNKTKVLSQDKMANECVAPSDGGQGVNGNHVT